MSEAGISCSSSVSSSWTTNRTYILKTDVVNNNGILTSWCVNATVDGQAQLKIFRDDGTNYIFVGESALLSIVAGINTGLACNISVLTGDLIGVYSIYTEVYVTYVLGDHEVYKSGNISTDSTKASWEPVSNIKSIIHAQSAFNNVYVDINKADDTGAGTSFATAKKTMKAGWDIIDLSGTMHVASGNYSAQATIAYNKSWKLSPEDPNSTGVKSVSIPKST